MKSDIEAAAADRINQHENRDQLDRSMPVGSFELPESVALLAHRVHRVADQQGYGSSGHKASLNLVKL